MTNIIVNVTSVLRNMMFQSILSNIMNFKIVIHEFSFNKTEDGRDFIVFSTAVS